jgi:hypothetical protein
MTVEDGERRERPRHGRRASPDRIERAGEYLDQVEQHSRHAVVSRREGSL